MCTNGVVNVRQCNSRQLVIESASGKARASLHHGSQSIGAQHDRRSVKKRASSWAIRTSMQVLHILRRRRFELGPTPGRHGTKLSNIRPNHLCAELVTHARCRASGNRVAGCSVRSLTDPLLEALPSRRPPACSCCSMSPGMRVRYAKNLVPHAGCHCHRNRRPAA
jgi:hypothetical protein